MNQNNTSEHPSTPSSIDAVVIPQSGPLLIRMTNDYLFRALLQRNNHVLKGLLCALLHLKDNEISSVTITNPIRLGERIGDKDFILDIRIVMNEYYVINLEMQVINLHNWQERSLSYLAREFDQLKKGDDYEQIQPVIQIGLLDYTLFPDAPEFYATYQFLNVKTHKLYSDKVRLSVLDLTHIDLATEEDKAYQIDYWASLFKATTWEELQMLAQNNDYFKEAAETVYCLSREEEIRLQCEAREDYYRSINGMNRMIRERDDKISEQKAQLSQKDAQLSEKDAQISEKDAQISEQKALIAALQAQLAGQHAEASGQTPNNQETTP